MPDLPTDHLALVIDNSSSSLSAISLRRAKPKRGSIHLCGRPREGQFRTAESDSPSSAASVEGPPNRAIRSDVSCMDTTISRYGTLGNPKVRYARNPQKPKDSVTSDDTRVTVRDVDASSKPFAEFGARLRRARIALTDGTAADFAGEIGFNPQTYRNYERGERMPDYEAVRTLAKRGMSLDWLFLAEKPVLAPARMAEAATRRQTG